EDSQSRMREVGSAWGELPEDKKTEYNREASSTPDVDPAEMTDLQRKTIYNDFVGQFNKLVKKIEVYDFLEVGIVLVNTRSAEMHLANVGTKKASDWMDIRQDVQVDFYNYVTGSIQGVKDTEGTKVSKKRQAVQQLFNEKYCTALGKSHGHRCSYKALDQGRLKAVGMPRGSP
ncbi:unnamed protein product, partial [Owenia fusiformis]